MDIERGEARDDAEVAWLYSFNFSGGNWLIIGFAKFMSYPSTLWRTMKKDFLIKEPAKICRLFDFQRKLFIKVIMVFLRGGGAKR